MPLFCYADDIDGDDDFDEYSDGDNVNDNGKDD